MANARKITQKALCEVQINGAYSNITLNKFLSESDLSSEDKSLASAIFYGVLDRCITLDYVLSKYVKTPIKKVDATALTALRVALYQIMFMDKIPESAAVNESVKLVKSSKSKHLSGFVNGVLRNILRDGISLPQGQCANSMSVNYSCPLWIVESFINDYGADNAEQLLKHSLTAPQITVRVNTLKTDTKSLKQKLLEENIIAAETGVDNSLNISGGFDISKSKAFKNGLFHIQDLSSQAAISILSPSENESVLDLCAAPGGKTFTMAQYMKNTGEITACDIYSHRLKLISDGAKRLGINTIHTQINDATVYNEGLGKFDAVLCDVLCSGLGVIRRKPEIKYKDISEYTDITKIQYQILENADKYLKENGRILYSTCTVRKCENEAIVHTFLDKHSGYELKYEHTFMPHIDGTDGFYCALLQKSR